VNPPERLVDAVALARAAAEEEAAVELGAAASAASAVGEHLDAVDESAEGTGAVVTHHFAAVRGGYRGWRWAVTLAGGGDAGPITVSEVVLQPGPDALVAPAWVPWEERVRPGDLGVGDLLPTTADDDRLVPAYLYSDDPAVEEVAVELGLGRVRVMSREGREETAQRWHDGPHGPGTDMARAAPAQCGTCGFFLPVAGSLRAAFGVCGNRYAPADGSVVAVEFGCGAHSDVVLEPSSPVGGGRARLRRRRRPGAGRHGRRAAVVGDPFGTAALRAAVLDAWAASPTASARTPTPRRTCGSAGTPTPGWSSWRRTPRDAARAAGVPGRLALALVELPGRVELRVANTGAPLDAAGVAALASLRASAKRDDSGAVGLFGVGFAAVLPLSDAPPRRQPGGRGLGRGGLLRRPHRAGRGRAPGAGPPSWPAAVSRRCCGLVWDLAELVAEVRRAGRPGSAGGYDTELRLPLRPGVDGTALLQRAAAATAGRPAARAPGPGRDRRRRPGAGPPRAGARSGRGHRRRAALAAGPPHRHPRRAGRPRGAGRRAARPAQLVGVLGAAGHRGRRPVPGRGRTS
jgi:hypothetical protein